MNTPAKLGTQAIGAAGELLVQYKPIKRGIDSARLTTDSGIDLVMYVPGTQYWRLEPPRGRKARIESDVDQYRFDVVIDGLLDGRKPTPP